MTETSRQRILTSTTAVSLPCALACVTPTAAASYERMKRPSVVLQASKTLILLPCPPEAHSIAGTCPSNSLQITLTSVSSGFRNAQYAYTVGVGRIVGEGNNVVWDLNDVWPGFHTATVEVQDSKKRRAVSSVTITVNNCPDCVHDHKCFCPPLSVMCYDEVIAGTPITCKFVMPPQRECVVQYVWSVLDSTDENLSARLTARETYVSIATEGLAGRTVYVKVEVKGLNPSCSATASANSKVKP